MAAVMLLLTLALTGQSLLALPMPPYRLLLGLAVGPQLLGHTAFNWAIKYLSATVVTVAILGEPIGSALLAWVIFQQPLQALQLVGGAVLLDAQIAQEPQALVRFSRVIRGQPAVDGFLFRLCGNFESTDLYAWIIEQHPMSQVK